MYIYYHNTGPVGVIELKEILSAADSLHKYDFVILAETPRLLTDCISEIAMEYLTNYNFVFTENVLVLIKNNIIFSTTKETSSVITLEFKMGSYTYVLSAFYLNPKEPNKTERFLKFLEHLKTYHPKRTNKYMFDIICGDINYDLIYENERIADIGKKKVYGTLENVTRHL